MDIPFRVDLSGKVAVITGGAGVLCGVFAEALAACGARVAILDRAKLGLDVVVFVQVRLSTQGRDAIAQFDKAIRHRPEVLDCYTLTGEWDFCLRIVTRDMKEYEAFFLDHLSKIPNVQSVNSSIAQILAPSATRCRRLKTRRPSVRGQSAFARQFAPAGIGTRVVRPASPSARGMPSGRDRPILRSWLQA